MVHHGEQMVYRLARLVCSLAVMLVIAPAAWASPDFAKDIAPILRQHCVACHGADDVVENNLVLTSYAALMKGGKAGPALVPGQAKESLLYTMSAGLKEPKMPPDDAPGLNDKELKLLEGWIAAGAKPPAEMAPVAALKTPRIEVTGPVRSPIVALALHPQSRWLAVGHPERVDLLEPGTRKLLRSLPATTGVIADVAVSANGQRLVVASGETGLSGQVTVYETSDWSIVATLEGHKDIIYSCQLNADGTSLLTGSYDRDLRFWNIGDQSSKRLAGHNDAVFGVALHPTRPLAASASGDRTVKVWNLADGSRLDTFAQPAKEQSTIAIRPDGKHIAAAGVDMRLRVWELSPTAAEGTNPLLVARFAHEGPILKLVYSPSGDLLVTSSEDRRLKVWETKGYTQVAVFDRQPDWTPALAVSPDDSQLFVGRMDGSLATIPLGSQLKQPVVQVAKLTEVPEGTVSAAAPALETAVINEVEPNAQPATAQKLLVGQTAKGSFNTAGDEDLYALDMVKGSTIVLETKAARNKSQADTKLEVLRADGTTVQRGWLQAVRDSWINFRPIDSNSPDVRVEFWEEMDLGQYLYMNGEVTKIARMPQGPDSGLLLVTSSGKRQTYFDTTAVAHQKDDPVYIVEAWPLGANVVDNGLPLFPIHYANDDDSERELGTDSRLTFVAPEDGTYFVRVADSRGFGGTGYDYELLARPLQPDFSVKLATPERTVPKGSGQRLTFTANRIDHITAPLEIEVSGLPAGWFVTSPIIIDEGALEGRGAIWAAIDAADLTDEQRGAIKITATSSGESRDAGTFKKLALAEPAKFKVTLFPDDTRFTSPNGGLLLAAGTTITAKIIVERNGFDGDIKFDVDGLPFGVIVDNIGLSGVLIRKGETERQIFLTARPWVAPTSRLITAVSQNEGLQTSPAVTLEVVSPSQIATSAK